MMFTVDHDAPTPLYIQLSERIIQQIERGMLPPGTRLPSTRDLADELGIARISVVNAYEQLKGQGVITAQVGRGTFVAEQAQRSTSRSTEIGDLLHLAERPDVIHFGRGTLPHDFLPVPMIQQAIDTVLNRDGAAALAYEVAEGFGPLRREVAAMVGAQFGISVQPDEVLITGGCQQALDLAVQALLSPGDSLLTATPTYTGILDIAQARGIIPVGVPVDDDGMQTDSLEALIEQHQPRLIYSAPTYHNPTGTVMPLHRRRHLLRMAERYHIPVLEDGVYQDLTYSGEPPAPLKALDGEGLVLHASSFSKVMMPGMRIGYLLVGGALRQRIARVKQAADVCTPALNQRAMHAALETGMLARHLAEVRTACMGRRAAMLTALRKHFPQARWQRPDGGLYLWVRLPEDGPTAADLFVDAVGEGVAFAPGPLFHTEGGGMHHLRLNMAAYPPEQIAEGIRRLARAWHQHTGKPHAAPIL